MCIYIYIYMHMVLLLLPEDVDRPLRGPLRARSVLVSSGLPFNNDDSIIGNSVQLNDY